MTRRKLCLAKDNEERQFREATQRGDIPQKKKKKKNCNHGCQNKANPIGY
jgi:hypothetical protein